MITLLQSLKGLVERKRRLMQILQNANRKFRAFDGNRKEMVIEDLHGYDSAKSKSDALKHLTARISKDFLINEEPG